MVRLLRKENDTVFVLGGGSNVLISDNGIRGNVILVRECCKEIKFADMELCCGAGADLSEIVRQSVNRGIKGMENLSGIPGTLGGALMMNAGAYGSEISNYLVEIELINQKNELTSLKKEEISFSYRSAPELQGCIIVSAKFRFGEYIGEEAVSIAENILELRKSKQPLEYSSAGSVFKKHPQGPAGKFIEEAGLKGERIGNAEVSTKHANFIVNKGGARAIEVLALMMRVQQRVKQNFGIELELEQKLIGFTKEELQNPERFI